MLFSSQAFILLFLPVSLIGYQLLSRLGRSATLAWLTGMSLVFYAYWNLSYLALLAASILVNFLFSWKLGAGKPESGQNRWLGFAIAANLALLIYYKYLFPLLNFFHDRGAISHRFTNVILPLGISFFTFTQIAYLIDLRQQIAKRQGLLRYSFFVTFFPHLIAGPIIHPREIMPQLEDPGTRGLSWDDVAIGLSWFIVGLAKKVLIADRIAPLAELLYDHPRDAGMLTTWFGAIAYAMQVYFDFSGYSDMAVALARMFGIRFPFNFDSPYKSQNFIEFWTRWHMTLSRYLNEYLYTPAVRWVSARRMDQGKKVDRKAGATLEGFFQMVFIPTMYTMVIAGVWHGAGLQFLIYGMLLGTYLVVNHAWRYLTPRGSRFHDVIPKPILTGVTFLSFVIGLVFFRATNPRDAFYIIGSLFGHHGFGPSLASNPYALSMDSPVRFKTIPRCLAALAICSVIVWCLPNTQEIFHQIPGDRTRSYSLIAPNLAWHRTAAWSVGLAALLCLCILMFDANARFLYFQF